MDSTKGQTLREIADATRTVFERDGVHAATMKAIAEEAGISRELLYYYVCNRDGAIQLMLDQIVEECVDSVRLWSENLEANQDEFDYFAPLFRRVFYGNDGMRRATHQVLMDLGRFAEVKMRVIDRVVDYLQTTEFYRRYMHQHDVPGRWMMTFAMYGCFGLLQAHPEITDRELAAVCREALDVR